MTLTTHHIPASPGLDPITVYMNDAEPGRGGLLVECYSCAWACFWGSMGNGATVQQFVSTSDEHYVANCLIRARRAYISNRKAEQREMEYLQRICARLIAYLKEQTP